MGKAVLAVVSKTTCVLGRLTLLAQATSEGRKKKEEAQNCETARTASFRGKPEYCQNVKAVGDDPNPACPSHHRPVSESVVYFGLRVEEDLITQRGYLCGEKCSSRRGSLLNAVEVPPPLLLNCACLSPPAGWLPR